MRARGAAYGSSWIKTLENDPKETRGAAVDAYLIADWLSAPEGERSMSDRQAGYERSNGESGETRAACGARGA